MKNFALHILVRIIVNCLQHKPNENCMTDLYEASTSLVR